MSVGDGGSGPPAFVRSHEHLIDFVDTASVGLHWVAADGTIVWANPADYEPLGYTAEEYVGHNIKEFHVDGDVIVDILERLTRGERLHNYEARLQCKDGSIRHVQITSSVLFEEDETGRRFVHTRCYTQDITQRKKLEEARDRFVSILGHDLRNPLSSIAVATDLLLRASDIPQVHRKSLERIARSSERMSRMIADLIDFARTMGNRMPLKRRPIDIAEVSRRIIDEVQQAYGVDIELEIDGNTRADADPDRLAQALSNLATNAVQHGEPPFRVSVRDAGEHVVLEVSNRGVPIAANAVRDVFEPFSQTTAADGLGLGLFIVSEIVTAHGGTIEVRSTTEQTIFTSRWPKREGTQP